MKVQIFIEHDIIIRHFLLSKSLSDLEKNHDVQYVFAKDPKGRIKFDVNTLGLKNVVWAPIDRTRLSKLIDLAKVVSMYNSRRTKAFGFVENIWKGILDKSHFRRLKIKSHPLIFHLFKKLKLQEIGENYDLRKVINDFAPDVLIHPTVLDGLFISDLCDLSKKMKIPFIALMNSWDNPSTKALAIGSPDRLVVWGEQTKNHAVDFMGVNKKDVFCFGAAQFEVYKQKPTVSKKEIYQLLGIPLDKKLILYAGSSKSINEINHLMTLDKECSEGILKNCHVIFRPHPWRAAAADEADFFSIDWKHLSLDPFMKPFFDSKATGEIKLPDYMDTHNILSACDLLISNVSTILLEAAIHGKPVICMVSDQDLEQSNFLRVVLDSLYFSEFLEKLEIPRCKDKSEVAPLILNLLKKSEAQNFKNELQEKVKYFVVRNEMSYADQLQELMINVNRKLK